MKKTILLIIVFVGVLLCAIGYADSHYRTAVGRKAPALWLEESDSGKAVNLTKDEGRFVLLNFWSSTDAASRRAANDYTAWLRTHPQSNISLSSVNVDDNEALFKEIVRRDSLIERTQHHLDGNAAKAASDSYGLDEGLGTLLISPDGEIVAHNPSPEILETIVRQWHG